MTITIVISDKAVVAREKIYSLIEERYSNIEHLSDSTGGVTRLISIDSAVEDHEVPVPVGASWIHVKEVDDDFIKNMHRLRAYAIMFDRNDEAESYEPNADIICNHAIHGNDFFLNGVKDSDYLALLKNTARERNLELEIYEI